MSQDSPSDHTLDDPDASSGSSGAGERHPLSAALVVMAGQRCGRAFPVEGEVVIGRGSGCQLVIVEDSVSRRHACVRAVLGGYEVEDFGSANGTRVNGRPIELSSLCNGDRISIGSRTVLMFTVRNRDEQQLARVQSLHAVAGLAEGVASRFDPLLGEAVAALQQTLHDLKLPARFKRALSEVDNALRRGVALNEELRAFGRARTTEMHAVEIGAMVEDVATLLRRDLPETVTLAVQTEPNLYALGESSKLFQAVHTVAARAVDAMPFGGILRIIARSEQNPGPGRLSRFLPPGKLLRIDVEDTGSQIDAPEAAALFEPFAAGGAHADLRMLTALAAVQATGGHIEVTRAPDQSNRVSLYLPRAPRRRDPPDARTTADLPEGRDP